jgi:hypothetical protein
MLTIHEEVTVKNVRPIPKQYWYCWVSRVRRVPEVGWVWHTHVYVRQALITEGNQGVVV